MPPRDFAPPMRGNVGHVIPPDDDYLVEGEEQPNRPSATAQIAQTLQIVLIGVLAVLSLAIFWLLALMLDIL